MKSLKYTLLSLFLAASLQAKELKVGIIDLKYCAEQSKLGKKEQEGFDALRKQMESVLGEKEKTLTDLNTKLNDAEYLDSLSLEAETDLKRKFRSLGQEFAQLREQYFQALQQADFKIIQGLTESVNEASKQLAGKTDYDLILNKNSSYFASPALDISKEIVVWMDKNYEEKQKEESVSNLKGSAPIPTSTK